MIYMKSEAILVVTVKITVFWDFMPCGLEEVWHLFTLTCRLQGRKWYFPNQIKWCSLQDRSLAHEMAEGEVNMPDLLVYIIFLNGNMSVPHCILV